MDFIPEVLSVLLIPIMPYVHNVHMALWVSKEPLGSQECIPISQITYINIVRGKMKNPTDLYFPLYFLEFPLYISGAFCYVPLTCMKIKVSLFSSLMRKNVYLKISKSLVKPYCD